MSKPSINLVNSLKKHEGLRLKAYLDTVGVWTIGYGHTLGVDEGLTCTPEQAESWLIEDVEDAIFDAEASEEWKYLNTNARKDVWIEMHFNLGATKLKQFIGTRKAIREQRWQDVAKHMLDSLWAKQVKGRAKTLANTMERGEWAL